MQRTNIIQLMPSKVQKKLLKEMAVFNSGYLQINLRGIPIFSYALWEDLVERYKK